MPAVGDVARAMDVGAPHGYHKVIWHACERCGRERWVPLRKGTATTRWCYPCGRTEGKPRGSKSRELSPRWKGGRHIHSLGYVQLVVPLDDPLLCMADSRGRVFEHRLVFARHLGRPLSTGEQVHHRNGNKQDNRLENLEMMTLSDHAAAHRNEVAALRARVQELECELAAREAPPP